MIDNVYSTIKLAMLTLLVLLSLTSCNDKTFELNKDYLINSKFVVDCDLWQSSPGPDAITFTADGNVINKRAGLAGKWSIISSTAFKIGNQLFRYNKDKDHFFSPLNKNSINVGWRIFLQP